MRCPRRDDMLATIASLSGQPFVAPDPEMGDGDEWGEDGCSYCGSLSPTEFLARAAFGEMIIPTDKNYKAYIGDYEKFYFGHLTREQRREFAQMWVDKKLVISGGDFYNVPYVMYGALAKEDA